MIKSQWVQRGGWGYNSKSKAKSRRASSLPHRPPGARLRPRTAIAHRRFCRSSPMIAKHPAILPWESPGLFLPGFRTRLRLGAFARHFGAARLPSPSRRLRQLVGILIFHPARKAEYEWIPCRAGMAGISDRPDRHGFRPSAERLTEPMSSAQAAACAPCEHESSRKGLRARKRLHARLRRPHPLALRLHQLRRDFRRRFQRGEEHPRHRNKPSRSRRSERVRPEGSISSLVASSTANSCE
jgi:hypothetical protein